MSENTLVAFAIDDDEAELEVLSRHLEQLSSIDIELHPYTDPNLAVIEFLNHEAELVFLDYQLGELTAIDVLEQIRRIGDLRPAIVLTGRGDEYAAAELMRAGADDYIVKSDLSAETLRASIARALAAYGKRLSEAEVVKHAFELERANEKLEAAKRDLEEMNARLRELSDADPITGILNHRFFVEQGEKELARSVRSSSPVSLAMLEVDRFPALTDRHGRLVGNQVLTEVAERLQENLRQYDIVARLGGESFGILFPETELSDAVLVTERCREAVLAMSLPLESTGATLGVSISAGVACNGTGPTSKLESLMQAAGAALCRVKEGTGNRVEAEGAED